MRPELPQFDMSVAAGDEQVGAEDDQAAPKRPAVARQETDWILSYYQQAGMESDVDSEGPPNEETQWTGTHRASTPSSTSSDSNSAYSFEDDEPTTSSPTRNESSDQGHERTSDNLGSPSPRIHLPRNDGERRNAGRRPSELSADRRRIAVIELNPVLPPNRRRGQRPSINTTTASSDQPRFANPRLAKKAAGIALVAPSDASPAAYTNLTPPSSAPAHITTTPNTELPADSKHKRSVSDVLDTRVVSPHKCPRDVGIVGQLDDTPSITRKSSGDIQSYFDIQGSKIPVFQTPHRSPMPSPIPESATASPQCPPAHPGQLTPEIGEAKDIHRPVAGPVIVDVNGAIREKSGPLLTPSFSPSVPSSYLYYQPGVHSVAGPPPPMITRPNRGDNVPTSPPPRPPRLHTPAISSSASNSNLRHAKEQSSTLPASKPTQLSPTKSGESAPAQDTSREAVRSAPGATGDALHESSPPSKSLHVREGAFPPSTTGSMSPTLPPELTQENSVSSVVSSSPSDESIPPPTPHKDDPLPVPARSLSRSASTSTSRSNPPHLPRSRPVSMHNKFTELLDSPSKPPVSPVVHEKVLPSPTAETFNLKRFSSLPRAPSISSGSNLSRGYSRTPSPLPPRRRKRIIEQWPLAMQYKDVLECKTPLERSLGYARKINELAMYDCGLTSWMDSVRGRALPKKLPSRSNPKPTLNLGRNMPSSYKEPPEGRKVSRDSFESGTTFPMRPDAHTATDLSTKTNDTPFRMEDLVAKAPVLPYPSLAPMTRTLTQTSTLTSPPSSMRSLPIPLPLSASKSTGGFFSSIGRKTSIRRDKEKRPPSPGKMPAKKAGSPPKQKSTPLPLISTPHIIGGPRAIPGRSQSIVAHPAARPEETQKRFDHKRRSTVSGRRPSLAPPPPSKSIPLPPNLKSHNSHHISLPPSSHKQGQTPGQAMFPDPQFNVQLDKLMHILPHADRNVLAGYLRRSGQDILAVGRYLEDEKNGSIMYH